MFNGSNSKCFKTYYGVYFYIYFFCISDKMRHFGYLHRKKIFITTQKLNYYY